MFLRSPFETLKNPEFTVVYGLKSDGKKTIRSKIELNIKSGALRVDTTTGSIFITTETESDFDASSKYGISVKFFGSHIFAEPVYYLRQPGKATDATVTHRRAVLGKRLEQLPEKDLRGKISTDRIYQIINIAFDRVSLDDLVSFDGGALELKTVKSFFSKVMGNKDSALRDEIGGAKQLIARMRNVRYIGPARVRSERYYRQQELFVSEISSDGRNLPMFLASLTDAQRRNFSKWVMGIFGYVIKL